jgi:hypothetical protein
MDLSRNPHPNTKDGNVIEPSNATLTNWGQRQAEDRATKMAELFEKTEAELRKSNAKNQDLVIKIDTEQKAHAETLEALADRDVKIAELQGKYDRLESGFEMFLEAGIAKATELYKKQEELCHKGEHVTISYLEMAAEHTDLQYLVDAQRKAGEELAARVGPPAYAQATYQDSVDKHCLERKAKRLK